MKALRSRLTNLSNWQVLGILVGVAITASFISATINRSHDISTAAEWWSEWFLNFGTEMFGATMVFILLELVVRSRQEKGRLIRQMRSKDNALALQAVAELGASGWLTDGSLNGAYLVTANLNGVNMWDTLLKGADLHGAVMKNARLQRVNFSGANLWNVNLAGARLEMVNLEGADLMHADLTGVVFLSVELDRHTRLPDGEYWSPAADLSRYGIRQEAPGSIHEEED